MNDQEMREKVIKGLECCVKRDPDDKPRCSECPYDIACLNRLKFDALALLKAQDARAMGVDEVREWVGKQRVDREPICVEVKDSICAWIVSDEYWDMPMDITLSSDLYGETWRCWTALPTDEQREKEPWDDAER